MLELVVTPTSLEFVNKCDFCDGFIVGEAEFSLRLPRHFTFQQIESMIKLCKKRHQKIYIAMNKIVHEDDLTIMSEYLNKLKNYPIDGIIYGDLAIYQLAKKLSMHHLLMYNPETYMTNYESVRFFAQKGIKRVTLAKEITLEDISLIASKKLVELDVLGHGAMNMFHSMRNLVTNYYKFLDKNEFHHNEELYLVEELREDSYPIIEDQNGTHVFSSSDLCTINYLDQFIEHGITAIRMDGLFKTDDVLYEITKVYRQAIDDYYEDQSLYMNKKESYLKQLKNIKGIRPFKDGFLFKKTVYKGGNYGK